MHLLGEASTPPGPAEVPDHSTSPGHAHKAHQPHWAHFQALPLTPHKPGVVHMIQHCLLLLATHFKAQYNRNHPVLMPICRNIMSTLNAHWKLLQLSAGVCAQPSIMERLGWMDRADQTQNAVFPTTVMEIQAWYLYSHTAYLSHIMSIHFQLCLFVLSSAQAVVQWLTTSEVKPKNNRSLPPAFRGHQQERKILCLVCGQGGQSQLKGMSALCCLSWRYQGDTDVQLQITTIHIHSLFTTDCGHLSCSVQEKLSNCESF